MAAGEDDLATLRSGGNEHLSLHATLRSFPCDTNTCSCKLVSVTDYDFAQRAVLGALLNAHPRLLDVDELGAQLSDVPRAHEALRVLVADGLATRLGDRVGVSRAAVRFEALSRSAT